MLDRQPIKLEEPHYINGKHAWKEQRHSKTATASSSAETIAVEPIITLQAWSSSTTSMS